MLTHANTPIPAVERYLAEDDIHELNRQPSSGTLVGTLLVAAILAVLHVINAYYLLWVQIPNGSDIYGYPAMPMYLFTGIHLILSLFALLYARARQGSERNDQRFDMLLVLSGLCLGAVGAVGSVLAILFFGFYQRYAMSFIQWFTSIFPMPVQTLPELINENIITGRDESAHAYSVIPFLDVMSIGSEVQKREALSKMTSQFHPSFAPAFRRALGDDNNAIRVQAATAIAKIENQFLERSIQLETLYRDHPKDDQLLLALARHYDEYAYTGILDSEREETNRVRALENYESYLSRHPQDIQVRLYIGRLLLRSERTAEAADWFRQSIDAGLSTPQMVTWYMECLYKLGRYDDLRHFAARFETAGLQVQPNLVESLHMWSHTQRGAA